MHVSIELAQAMAHLHPSAQPAANLGSIYENPEFCEGGGDPTLGGEGAAGGWRLYIYIYICMLNTIHGHIHIYIYI